MTVSGNLAGSLFFAAIFVKYTGLVTEPINTFITNAANSRGSLPWHQVFLRGIGCNIMVGVDGYTFGGFPHLFSRLQVCLAVYVATQAADVISKIAGIYMTLSVFVVLQMEHVVADMFLIPM